jgi:hypothetical protein
VSADWARLRAVTGGLSPWGSAVTRLHRFQGEHPEVQFTSPVMGRHGQYTALVPPCAIPGESREITVTSPDLCGLMDELEAWKLCHTEAAAIWLYLAIVTCWRGIGSRVFGQRGCLPG